MLRPPVWWSLLMQHCGVPAGTGRKVWKALALASDHDAELRAFVFTLHTLPHGPGFLEALRRVFRQHVPPWWITPMERLVLQGLLPRRDGSILEEQLLHFVDPIGHWK